MENAKELLDKVELIETQFPNYPKWKKFEMVNGDFSKDQIEQAFEIIWDKLY